MALILPTTDDLNDYIEGQSDENVIQQAMDLFVLATGLNATSSPLEDRLVKNAVLEMSWALKERHDSKEEEFSNSTGERIGSYSYTKAARAIGQGSKTGVSAFDTAVDYFLAQALGAGGSASVYSEFVFTREDFFNGRFFTSDDPSYMFEPTDDWKPVPPIYSVDDDVDYDDLPAGTTITLMKQNGVWPGAPTTRADTIIIWKGAEPSPPIVTERTLGQPGMLSNVDIRMIV